MSQRWVESLNQMTHDDFVAAFRACCGSEWWCNEMSQFRPFEDMNEVKGSADRVFAAMPRDAWLEAFSQHPRIGDLQSLKMKFAGNERWSGGEQSGVADAGDDVLLKLQAANNAYLEKFGYIFIVCATGKSAAEMLAILYERLPNAEDDELPIAAQEQRKITHIRIDKLASEHNNDKDKGTS